jgi:hypothetical protein
MAFEDQGSMDFKQHINLSERAWNTIENDMLDFYGDRKSRLSNFLNRVFAHFYPSASSSITLELERKREKYAGILEKITGFTIKNSLRGDIISKLVDYDEEKLKKRVAAYPKGEGRKFRLNKANMTYLTDADSECGEDHYYNNKIGRYLKAVFEEYTKLPYYRRERIFFLEEISAAKAAIQAGKCLKITSTVPGLSGNPVKYEMLPYRIMTDRQSMYNYLVGCVSRPGGKELTEQDLTTFRISRIKEIKIMRSKSGKLNVAQKHKLEDLLLKNGPAFLRGDIKSIKVKLTEAGKKNYHQQLHLRPAYDEILEDNIYVFRCSERQITNYFIKFGKDALVIDPLPLKKQFLDFFSDSHYAYS